VDRECDLNVVESYAQEVWNLLVHRGSSQILEQDLKKRSERHGKPENHFKERAIDASLCFTHAKAYFDAASSASMSVRPELLYYAAYSLAASVILCLSPKAWTLEKARIELGKSHGLQLSSDFPAQLDLKKSSSKMLESLGCQPTKRGTFRELCNLLDTDYITVPKKRVTVEGTGIGYQSRIVIAQFDRKPDAQRWAELKNTGLTMLHLLASMPDLAQVLQLVDVRSQIRPCSCTARCRNASGDLEFLDVACSFETVPEANKFKKERFPTVWNPSTKGASLIALMDVKNMTLPIPFPPATEASWGDPWLFLTEEPKISEFPRLFASLYVLSMLVRYCPDVWKDMSIERNDVFRVFEELCEIASSRLPQFALNWITGRLHYFTGSI